MRWGVAFIPTHINRVMPMGTSADELQKMFDEIDRARQDYQPHRPQNIYECDCGRRVRTLDALYACQGNQHR